MLIMLSKRALLLLPDYYITVLLHIKMLFICFSVFISLHGRCVVLKYLW